MSSEFIEMSSVECSGSVGRVLDWEGLLPAESLCCALEQNILSAA